MNPDTQCKAVNRSGKRCGKPAVPGATVCRNHGAAAPQVAERARLRVVEDRARTELARLGLGSIDIDPAQALLAEVGRTAANVEWLSRKVASLTDEDLVWGISKVSEGRGQHGAIDLTEQSAEVSVWVKLWMAERSHLVKVSEAAIRAGIAERLVRLQEQEAAVIVGVVQAVIHSPELGLDSAKRAVAETVAHRALMAAAEAVAS